LLAWQNFQQAMNDSVFQLLPSDQLKSACTFDPDALPN